MNQDKYVFTQITDFLNRSKFNRIVAKYNGDRYIKSYSFWNQLLTLIFGQIGRCSSLRNCVIALQAHYAKLYHLGIGKNLSRSNLAKANERRDYRIFEELQRAAQSPHLENSGTMGARGLQSIR